MKGKNVIVTGGGSGYGKGIAAVLVDAGMNVWITGRNQAKLEQAAGEIGAKAIVADVTNGADWDRVFADVGTVDVLVNNAGCGGRIVAVADQSDSAVEEVVSINLTGAIKGSVRAARMMSERRTGAIINISSVCAHHAWPGWSVYTAAKAGLLKFSHGLFTELRPFDVRVTCIVPSWGQTDFNRAAGIQGESGLESEFMSGDQMGHFVLDILSLPDNLVVPEVTIQPMVQEIIPM